MKRFILSAFFAAPLMAGPVLAQTNPPAAGSTAPATAPSTRSDAAAAAWQGPFLGTQMWKQAVYDANDARIGEIDQLVISPTGQIQEVVIGVGGFLGIGEKAVALPYTTLKPMLRNNQLWFVVNQTKEQLQAAPAFDTSKFKR